MTYFIYAFFLIFFAHGMHAQETLRDTLLTTRLGVLLNKRLVEWKERNPKDIALPDTASSSMFVASGYSSHVFDLRQGSHEEMPHALGVLKDQYVVSLFSASQIKLRHRATGEESLIDVPQGYFIRNEISPRFWWHENFLIIKNEYSFLVVDLTHYPTQNPDIHPVSGKWKGICQETIYYKERGVYKQYNIKTAETQESTGALASNMANMESFQCVQVNNTRYALMQVNEYSARIWNMETQEYAHGVSRIGGYFQLSPNGAIWVLEGDEAVRYTLGAHGFQEVKFPIPYSTFMQLSDDGKYVAVGARNGDIITFFSALSGKKLYELSVERLDGLSDLQVFEGGLLAGSYFEAPQRTVGPQWFIPLAKRRFYFLQLVVKPDFDHLPDAQIQQLLGQPDQHARGGCNLL